MKAGIGFLFGVSVGAGLGMMLASQSGKQTRAAIRTTLGFLSLASLAER